MRLTRRGWAVLAVLAGTYVAAYLAGERALNAVAAPLLAALVVGAVLVWRADPPTLSYSSLRPGFPGDERTLTVTAGGGGVVTVEQPLPDGLDATAIDAAVTPPHSFERPVTLARRGVYRLESPTVRQRDPLGLVSTAVTVDPACEFVVYPTIYDLDDRHVTRLFSDENAAERQEFDRLREYVPGDPLRNVHWKSSAKRDDLLVMEFAPAEHTETVTVAADADEGHADAMAAAAATVALAALDADLQVALTIPDDHLAAGLGETHRGNVLRLLAGATAGRVSAETHAEAEVSVRADANGTHVRIGDRFVALRDGGDTREVSA